MTMRVLVTGGAGFLGVNLAHHLSMQGVTVISLDIATSIASEYPPGTIFRVGDVRDPGTVSRTLAETGPIDVVIHAAAALPLWRPHDIRTTNIAGTHTVLDCARSAGVPRTVFISSTAVYGVPDKHPMDETDPMIGVGPYGESKVAAEQICAAYRAQGYCVPVVRPKTFLGPGRLGVFQILYDWVFAGKRIPILGPGHNRYQLLEVGDLCDAIWRAATHASDRVNDTFNVGASRFATVAEDVGELCLHAGTRAQIFPVPAWPAKTALRTLEAVNLSPLYRWVYGTADRDSYVSTDKISDALDWHPRHSNAEALIQAYDWYVEHRAELGASTGVTHRVAWDQGALGVLKKLL